MTALALPQVSGEAQVADVARAFDKDVGRANVPALLGPSA